MKYTSFKFTPKGMQHLQEGVERLNSRQLYEENKNKLWENYDFSKDKDYTVLREARQPVLGPALQRFLNQQADKGIKYDPQNKVSADKLYRDFIGWSEFQRLGITPSSYQVKQAAIALGSSFFGRMDSPLTGHRVEEVSNLQEEAVKVVPPAGTDRLKKYEQQFNKMVENAEDTVEEEESSVDRKYRLIYQMVRGVVSGRLQKNSAVIAGQAGIGKTFSAKKALEDMGYKQAEGDLLSSDQEYIYNQGSIGNSASNIIAFFYRHRDNEIIVLDDCDSFLVQNDDEIQNLLKGLLTTGKQGGRVTISAGVAKRVAKFLSSSGYFSGGDNDEEELDSLQESNSKKLAKHLRENYLNLSGIYDAENEDWTDKKNPKEKEDKKKEAGLEAVDKIKDLLKDTKKEKKKKKQEEVSGEVDNPFLFTSKLICITNLSLDQLNTAVRSRSNCYEIYLTSEEFMAQLKKVIKNLGTKDSPLPPEEYSAYKDFCYDLFCAAIESANSGYPLFGVVPRIDIELEFRVLLTVIDGCIMETLDKSLLEMTDLEKTRLAVKLYKGYILPTLNGATV